jgi:hypothetical protein
VQLVPHVWVGCLIGSRPSFAHIGGDGEAAKEVKAWLLTAVLVTTGVEAILVGIALTVARLG